MEPHAMELLLLLALVPSAAQAASMLSPVVVEGRTALLVTAISPSGTIAGTIGGTFVTRTGEVTGFTRDGAGGLTILAPGSGATPNRQVPVPTSINDKGIVAGIASGVAGSQGFVARLGKVMASFGPAGLNALPGLPLLTQIDHHGTVAYNTYAGSGVYPGFFGQSGDHGFAWHEGHFSELLPAPSPARTTTVTGASDAGDVPLNLLGTKTGTSIPYVVAHCNGKGC